MQQNPLTSISRVHLSAVTQLRSICLRGAICARPWPLLGNQPVRLLMPKMQFKRHFIGLFERCPTTTSHAHSALGSSRLFATSFALCTRRSSVARRSLRPTHSRTKASCVQRLKRNRLTLPSFQRLREPLMGWRQCNRLAAGFATSKASPVPRLAACLASEREQCGPTFTEGELVSGVRSGLAKEAG